VLNAGPGRLAVKRIWRRVVEVTSVVGVLASAVYYKPAVVGVIVKLNGWTVLLVLSLSGLCIGGVLEFRNYLAQRFASLDESLRQTVTEESNSLARRITEETTRLDAAIKREIDNRVGGDLQDRDRIGQLESRVGQLENQNRRTAAAG